MHKHIIKRIFTAFLAGVLIAFWNINPAQSQSVVACASNPSCATSMGLTRGALSIPAPTNPFALAGSALTNKATGAVIVTGGAAVALGYLTNQDMQSLQEDAKSRVVPSFLGGQSIGIAYRVEVDWQTEPLSPIWQWGETSLNIGTSIFPSVIGPITKIGLREIDRGGIDVRWSAGTSGSIINETNRTKAAQRDSVRAIRISRVDGQPDIGGNLQPSLSAAVSALPDAAIFAAAASSAAAAAANPELSPDDRISAATAAIAAAAESAAASNASPADISKASSASSAATAAAVAAQNEKDAAAAKDPTNPANVAAGRVNFVIYAVQVFSTKFPFDFFYAPSQSQALECPAWVFFYYRFEFCFLVPLFNALRWIATIGVGLKMIYTL
jgi:hypothetical protein